MPVIRHESVPHEAFTGGATYQTLVGDPQGSTPVRVGIQTSPPGYRTRMHSHPYMEVVTVLEGRGEGWIDGQDEVVRLEPGVTLVFPAHTRHWFQATGDQPLRTLGVHASSQRITNGAE